MNGPERVRPSREQPRRRSASKGATAGRRRRWGVVGLAVLGLAALALVVLRPEWAGPPLTMGAVTGCKQLPAFAAAQGFGAAAAISTNDPQVKGLILLDPHDPAHRYIHPSCDDAGSLGPFVWDADGNLYTAPSPRMNPADNPSGVLNTVYRVDAQTAAMRSFVALPAPPGIGQANPYGIVGLAFDCDTRSLYVATVAGSSKDSEIGHIYRIDVPTATVAADRAEVDAMGLGVFNGSSGKRLYFGPARSPEIQSVALDRRGNFRGEARYEAPLPGNSRARKITFAAADGGHVMTVAAMPFAFSLRASSEREETYETFRYDPARDTFDPVTPGS